MTKEDVVEEDKKYTKAIIFNKCRRFKVGDMVHVITKQREGGMPSLVIKTPGKVLVRTNHYLVLGIGKNLNIRECFTYTDIVLFGKVVKVMGRKKKCAV